MDDGGQRLLDVIDDPCALETFLGLSSNVGADASGAAVVASGGAAADEVIHTVMATLADYDLLDGSGVKGHRDDAMQLPSSTDSGVGSATSAAASPTLSPSSALLFGQGTPPTFESAQTYFTVAPTTTTTTHYIRSLPPPLPPPPPPLQQVSQMHIPQSASPLLLRSSSPFAVSPSSSPAPPSPQMFSTRPTPALRPSPAPQTQYHTVPITLPGGQVFQLLQPQSTTPIRTQVAVPANVRPKQPQLLPKPAGAAQTQQVQRPAMRVQAPQPQPQPIINSAPMPTPATAAQAAAPVLLTTGQAQGAPAGGTFFLNQLLQPNPAGQLLLQQPGGIQFILRPQQMATKPTGATIGALRPTLAATSQPQVLRLFTTGAPLQLQSLLQTPSGPALIALPQPQTLQLLRPSAPVTSAPTLNGMGLTAQGQTVQVLTTGGHLITQSGQHVLAPTQMGQPTMLPMANMQHLQHLDTSTVDMEAMAPGQTVIRPAPKKKSKKKKKAKPTPPPTPIPLAAPSSMANLHTIGLSGQPLQVRLTVPMQAPVQAPLNLEELLKQTGIVDDDDGNASLATASLANASLTTASLANASLTTASLANASLANATLANTSLANVSLANASLTTASLANASLATSLATPTLATSVPTSVDEQLPDGQHLVMSSPLLAQLQAPVATPAPASAPVTVATMATATSQSQAPVRMAMTLPDDATTRLILQRPDAPSLLLQTLQQGATMAGLQVGPVTTLGLPDGVQVLDTSHMAEAAAAAAGDASQSFGVIPQAPISLAYVTPSSTATTTLAPMVNFQQQLQQGRIIVTNAGGTIAHHPVLTQRLTTPTMVPVSGANGTEPRLPIKTVVTPANRKRKKPAPTVLVSANATPCKVVPAPVRAVSPAVAPAMFDDSSSSDELPMVPDILPPSPVAPKSVPRTSSPPPTGAITVVVANQSSSGSGNNPVVQRVQTIQLSLEHQQQLKAVQTQIQSLNSRKTKSPAEQAAYTRLLQLQTKILAAGKPVPTIPGQHAQGFQFFTSPQASAVRYYHQVGNQVISLAPGQQSTKTATTTSSTSTTTSTVVPTVTAPSLRPAPVAATSTVTASASDVLTSVATPCTVIKQEPDDGTIAEPMVSLAAVTSTASATTVVVAASGMSTPTAILTPVRAIAPAGTIRTVVSTAPVPASSSPPTLTVMTTTAVAAAMAKRASAASKSVWFDQQLKTDQGGALTPDCKTPFKDHLDAVKRLVRFHVFHEPQDESQDLELKKADRVYQTYAEHLRDKHQAMLNKYRYLLLQDSMRQVPSAELVMLNRMVLAEERTQLEAERQKAAEAAAAPLEPPEPEPPPRSPTPPPAPSVPSIPDRSSLREVRVVVEDVLKQRRNRPPEGANGEPYDEWAAIQREIGVYAAEQVGKKRRHKNKRRHRKKRRHRHKSGSDDGEEEEEEMAKEEEGEEEEEEEEEDEIHAQVQSAIDSILNLQRVESGDAGDAGTSPSPQASSPAQSPCATPSPQPSPSSRIFEEEEVEEEEEEGEDGEEEEKDATLDEAVRSILAPT